MSRPVVALLTLCALAACAAPDPGGLVAVLTSPTAVYLTWVPEPGAAGQTVEYADDPAGVFTVLRYAQPGENSFEHADLLPATWFHYRVRPYAGPVSEAVDVALPPGDDVPPDDPLDWVRPRKSRSGTGSVRSADASPVGLRAEVKHANGILFTWTDRAADEEGYLLEARPEGAAEFSVVAVAEPDVTSLGLVTLPGEKHAVYRVRAYSHGPASLVAQRRTGT